MRSFTLLVALLSLLAATAAAGSDRAAQSTYVIQGDRTVGGVVMGRGTTTAAISRLGPPSRSAVRAQSCTLTWTELGAIVTFLAFSGEPCKEGVAVVAVVTKRVRWRTDRGLRVGDTLKRAKLLYPRSTRHGAQLWLLTRRACAEVGGQPYAGLQARLRDGRVAAFTVTTGVCE
jgi:hypothetical protein